MYGLKLVFQACGKICHLIFTYHANFCCYKIAESVEPFHIGLKVTRLLLFTETSLGRKKHRETFNCVSVSSLIAQINTAQR